MSTFEVKQFRQQFPLLCNYDKKLNRYSLGKSDAPMLKPVVYFDNGATTQKPNNVIDSYQSFYKEMNANVHRASHSLSAKATSAFEEARQDVKGFINASSQKEIIWTKGTTESINLIASTLGYQQVKANDEIIISVSEHHANIVPWQILAEKVGAIVHVLTLDELGRVDLPSLDKLINSKTKIICCSHVSNVIGKVNPIEDVIKKAKKVGAYTIIDGAQAIAHFPVDVQKLDCDFYVFSAHKMYGPTGVGVLYGKQAILDVIPPYQSGGEMIKTVSFERPTTFNELPFKFEAGTPNISGVIAFSQAIRFIKAFEHQQVHQYECSITQYCYQSLAKIPQVSFVFKEIPEIPVLAFTVDGHHNHDIATALDSLGVAIRSGHHCAMPLMEYLTIQGCLRISLAPYNTINEIDYFIDCLSKIIDGSIDNIDDTSIKTEKLTVALSAELINEQFSNIVGWHNRHREIMLLSKKLVRLDKKYRNDNSLIQGCESLAWLTSTKEQGCFYFHADSDAKIIRGLLVIVLAAFNGKTAVQIQGFDINNYFETLGLMQQLSPSRGNGVLAIVEKIKKLSL